MECLDDPSKETADKGQRGHGAWWCWSGAFVYIIYTKSFRFAPPEIYTSTLIQERVGFPQGNPNAIALQSRAGSLWKDVCVGSAGLVGFGCSVSEPDDLPWIQWGKTTA